MSRITSIFFKENRKNSVSKSENPGHIGSLDGIRGVAILMVFAEHYGDIAEHTHSAPLLFIQHLKSTGWLGVDLFFALSGYLITGILWKTRSDKNRARNFYAKRVLRLFPVYYGVWFFLLCYSAITSIDWNPRVFLEYLLYAGNFAAPYHINIGPFQIVHFWSLAVEEQFYLIWPLLLWNMPSKKSAMRLLAALFSASVLIKIAYLLLHVNHAYHYLPTHMEAIASGSFIALANVERAEVWQRYAKLGLVISLPALMIAFAIFHGLNMTKLPVLIVAFPLVAIAASSLILRSQNPDSFLSKLMNLRLLKFYGKVSYGLYIYHNLLRDVLKKLLYTPIDHFLGNPLLAGAIYFPLALICCTLIAVLSFNFYEKPFLKLKHKFEDSPRTLHV